MRFLKTLFWMLAASIVAIFSARNWMPVTINLWGGLQADIKLPVLIFAGLLIGFLPPFLMHNAYRWRSRRQIDILERNLALATTPSVDATFGTAPTTPPSANPSTTVS